jgi:hypothetical protein
MIDYFVFLNFARSTGSPGDDETYAYYYYYYGYLAAWVALDFLYLSTSLLDHRPHRLPGQSKSPSSMQWPVPGMYTKLLLQLPLLLTPRHW